MLICPKCKRGYDDSWRTCLHCNVPLKKNDKSLQETEDTGYKQFPGSKFTIVSFTILIMILAPILIIILYLIHLQALDIGFTKHKKEQLKKVILFDKGEKAEKEKLRK